MNTTDLPQLLDRGVDTVYPNREALAQRLLSGQPITLYLGVDPTGTQLHIGHTVVLRKLAQFQKAGHKVILLIGDFTGRIGDPTGKDKTRVPLTPEQIALNAESYKEQASLILDFDHPTNPVVLKYNSTWLAKLTFEDVVKLAAHFTAQQMLERDMFANRMAAGKPISLHEFFYPLMQGYDSVAMDVDLEIGGTDQTFNMLTGRTLQRVINNREKFVLTVPLLADSKGVKIGKTAGNVIAITDAADKLYGGVMSLGDEVIMQTFELCTDVPMEEIEAMGAAMKNGANPRDYKMRLAREVVTLYHSAEAAVTAEEHFTTVFGRNELPTDMPKVPVPGSTDPLEILVALQLAPSRAEARRLLDQGGVKINNEKHPRWDTPLILTAGDIIQVGKRKFIQLV